MVTPPSSQRELPKTRELIEQGIARGLHIGAQLYVSVHGRPVAELAFGESRPGVAMTLDSLVLWLSSSKPVGAVAIMQQVERGKLRLDEPIARYIPEFAQGGKQAITAWHILTHTGGFRNVEIRPLRQTWDQLIAEICAAPIEPGWTPGQKAGYHPLTSWFILGELVRRLDGRPFSQYVREEIFEPLEMHDSWIGIPHDTFQQYCYRIAILPNMQLPQRPPHPYSTDRGATVCIPGGNGYGPMRELGTFYEMLLAGGSLRSARVLRPESVAEMTSRQRVGMYDETFRHKLDWGLGLIINSNRYGAETVPYGFGLLASDATFGHGGAQSSVGFADPQYDLVAAVMLNGLPGEAKHQKRIRQINTAIYQDLAIATGQDNPTADDAAGEVNKQ